jgi:anaerobic carbon-monoxide dehydrogenase iron sulfur subunit
LADTPSSQPNVNAVKPRRAGVIQPDVNKCYTCRECEVACSLYHEQHCAPEESRIHIDFDDFAPGFPDIRVCKQCDWPACYYACVSLYPDPAMSIDPVTGARYVDEAKCKGCGACLRACPLTPERAVIAFKQAGRKKIYFKCDLCRGRDEGPICVQVCPAGCLTYVTAEARRK